LIGLGDLGGIGGNVDKNKFLIDIRKKCWSLPLTENQSVISIGIVGETEGEVSPKYVEYKEIEQFGKKLEKDLMSKQIINSLRLESLMVEGECTGSFKATVNYMDNFGHLATGHAIAQTSTMAKLKALAEGFERHQSGQFFYNQFSSIQELEEKKQKYIDPELYLRQADEYIKDQKLTKLTKTESKYWVKAIREYSKMEELVLCDTIFYPTPNNYYPNRYCEPCSNGISAHSTREMAIKGGILEVIERDALMICWYCKRVPKTIRNSSLSTEIQMRIKYWAKKGFELVFFDISIDSVPVVMSCFFSENYPAFLAGTSASFSYNEAILKALSEVESMLNYTLNNPNDRVKIYIEKDVNSILAHAYRFFYPETNSELDYLRTGEVIDCPQDKEIDLIQKYDPVVVDFQTDPNLCDLKVVKVIIPQLLDINFGYGSEFYFHPRYKELKLKAPVYPAKPHFFA
jgi:thiazole/oxazole-forming peptide maturase SagD family component